VVARPRVAVDGPRHARVGEAGGGSPASPRARLRPVTTVARRWTVTTWNLRGTERPPLDRVADHLASTSSDVVVLQEVQRAQADDLAGRLAMTHTWARKHYPRTPLLAGQAEGLAILTPHALREPGSRELTKASSWSWRRRIVQWALVERADHSAYRVVNLHLSPHDEHDRRVEEAERIREWFVPDAGAPLVLAGDVNDDGGGVVAALQGVEHVAAPPTCPPERPTTRLDRVLLPAAATGVTVDVPAGGPAWAELSDHLPLTVAFDLDWVQGDFAP
jgi:endonuclease/exonuclease/phosphatase family metal-dependent hydrolase